MPFGFCYGFGVFSVLQFQLEIPYSDSIYIVTIRSYTHQNGFAFIYLIFYSAELFYLECEKPDPLFIIDKPIKENESSFFLLQSAPFLRGFKYGLFSQVY